MNDASAQPASSTEGEIDHTSPPAPLATPLSDSAAGRFVFIDALRGGAAMSVVLGHAYFMSAISAPLPTLLPAWVTDYGATYLPRGVQVFFVISGFVIAHSLRKTPMTLRGCGNFIIRRQLRLDPPYWVMIVISVLIFAIGSRITHTPWPSVSIGLLLGNLFYLQRILDQRDLIFVGWTLAVEIQFYFAFLLILCISRRASVSKTAVALLVATALGALTTDPNVTFDGRWAAHAWPYFVAGVLCYWSARQRLSAWPMLVVLGGMLGSSAVFGLHSMVVVGVMVALACYFAGVTGRLHSWGSFAPLQYLGRISYSLYLCHMTIVLALQQVSKRLIHGPAGSIGMFFAAIVLSIVAADLLHRAIERPSMRLAARFKPDRSSSPASDIAEPMPTAIEMKKASSTAIK